MRTDRDARLLLTVVMLWCVIAVQQPSAWLVVPSLALTAVAVLVVLARLARPA